MADEDDEPDDDEAPEGGDEPDFDDDEEGEEGEGGPPKKSKRLKLLLIIGGAVLLLLAIGLGVFFSGVLDSILGLEEEVVDEDVVVQGQVFYKLEEITLNLNAKGKKSRFLKVGLTVVLLNESDVPRLEAMQPRITDYVSAYLRELRPEEMTGSANFYRIRENILRRVRIAVVPVQVTNVLFDSFLVQ